jgi:starvation-inducible DNA-binding protein
MSTPATASAPAHLPQLGAHERESVGAQLQDQLVELIDLSLVGKQLHWTVTDPLFRPLHLHLDELVDSWHDLGDTVAERAVAIGYWPDGRAETVAASVPHSRIERGPLDARTVLRELVHRLAEVTALGRDRIDRVGELDPISQDVLIDVIRELEEQLWMLRAQLPNGA